ncbi:MAG TPA: TIGR01777 family oxidoreductase [Nakamurella sp.]|nr:TIGR01777 family oxidoreductase [Nakamurella sp.]
MRIVAAGTGGFIGGHLVPALRAAGHTVTTLVRRPPRGDDEVPWDPDAGLLPAAALDGADAVVNLCGAGAGDRWWTPARKRVLRSSRVNPTGLLAAACARRGVPALLNASAVGYYGHRGDETVTEADGPGDSFLARLCVDWEAATAPAAEAGVRVVTLRTGLVLGPDGGMLPRLALLTRMLLGGRLGSGRQYWPWISIADQVAAIGFLCREPVHGPVNLTAPHPVTNAEFTAELGRVVHRPTPWVIPSPALHAVLDGFAEEVVTGQRAVPAALTAAGFTFLHRDLGTALRAWAG